MSQDDDQATITPYRDGPLLVRGPVRLVDQDGNELSAWHAEWSVRTVWPQPAP